MEYGPHEDFIRTFVLRTSENLQKYDGDYDATNLINCLLGMLVFVHESSENFLNSSIHDYQRDAIITCPDGKEKCMDKGIKFSKNPYSMKNVIKHMRNAIAHCRIKPIHEKNEVKVFIFEDKLYGLTYWSIMLNLETIRDIAEALVKQVQERKEDKSGKD